MSADMPCQGCIDMAVAQDCADGVVCRAAREEEQIDGIEEAYAALDKANDAVSADERFDDPAYVKAVRAYERAIQDATAALMRVRATLPAVPS